MAFSVIIIMICGALPQWSYAVRPNIFDIKALELLYREGLQETNELIRQAKIPIENIITAGKLNITQQIKDSQYMVSSSSGSNSECAKIHAATLHERVNPEFINNCNYHDVLEDALNKWNAVMSHIVFCSMSSTNTCVDETKEEIRDLKVTNAERIPEAVRLSDSCRRAHCEGVVGIIAEIDASFQKCLQNQ
ncbi:hypothetical protein RI129_007889 [Pyrocoelia pectoralis]|uniref:Uncharacterized protein n=1 Tax=Pyrocoelia pectoralis TaxID=417401 RepID=A0AAN7VIG8_9COLE